VNVGVTPDSVTIPAGQSVTVQATLSIPASAFAGLPSDDTFSIGPGSVLTVRGDIVATPAEGDTADDQTLTVPYLVAPRGLSNVVAGTPSAFTKANDKVKPTPGTKPQKPEKPAPGAKDQFTSSLSLTNDGIHDGTADLYQWGLSDPNEGGQPMDVRDVGVQVQPPSFFDGAADTDRGIVFLINTWGQAANQSVNEYDVLIDTNHDGQADYVVFGFDLGDVLTGTFNGQYGSFTLNVATGDIVDAYLADAPMNGSTIELPTLASDLGLFDKGTKLPPGQGPAQQQFTYTVNSFSEVPGTFVDTTGVAAFNPFSPALSNGVFNEDGSLTAVPAGGTASLPLTVDRSELKKQSPLGWLVASVDDANGAPQADEVSAPDEKSLK